MNDVLKRAIDLRASGKDRTPNSYGELVSALSDPSNLIRVAAVQGLGLLQNEQAIPVLARVLALDSCPAVRWDAAEALGALQAHASYIIPGAHDIDPRVRRAVAGALADSSGGADTLLHLSQDTDTDVASKARWALALINRPHQPAGPICRGN